MAIGSCCHKMQKCIKYLTLKIHGQGQTRWSYLKPRVQSIYLLSVFWQSYHFWLSYNKFYIRPRKFKFKVTTKWIKFWPGNLYVRTINLAKNGGNQKSCPKVIVWTKTAAGSGCGGGGGSTKRYMHMKLRPVCRRDLINVLRKLNKNNFL